MSELLLLLDHDNLREAREDALSIIEPWLTVLERRQALPPKQGSAVSLDLRVYGGWFDGHRVTKSRYDAWQTYDNTWPVLVERPQYRVRIKIEFADYLLGRLARQIQHKITHTVTTRHKPLRMRPTDQSRSCSEGSCERTKVRDWLKRGSGCTSSSCPNNFADCFERLEQKQVDIHLAMDLISAVSANGAQHVALASDDLDFTPALMSVGVNNSGTSSLVVVRTNRRPQYSDEALRSLGIEIVYVKET